LVLVLVGNKEFKLQTDLDQENKEKESKLRIL